MIDEDLIQSIKLVDPEASVAIKRSLSTLAQSGVLNEQRLREIERLVVGDESEDPGLIAKQVVAARHRIRALQTLQSLGEQYTRELNES